MSNKRYKEVKIGEQLLQKAIKIGNSKTKERYLLSTFQNSDDKIDLETFESQVVESYSEVRSQKCDLEGKRRTHRDKIDLPDAATKRLMWKNNVTYPTSEGTPLSKNKEGGGAC